MAELASEGRIGFGEFVLDSATARLTKGGAAVAVQPKVLRLLAHLVEHRDRVVSREELLDRLWPRQTVVPAVLTTAVRTLRRALGDDARAARFIETAPTFGYRFVADVSHLPAAHAPPGVAEAERPFIGRRRECERFRAGVANPASSARVLFVHGPTGIGKSTLLRELSWLARRLGHRVTRLELGLGMPPALDGLLGNGGEGDRSEGGSCHLLFLDNYERSALVDEWVREELLDSLPKDVRLVIASRGAPLAFWRAHPRFGTDIEVSALSAFSRTDSAEFLRSRAIDSELHDALHQRSGGHPLTLALECEAISRGCPLGDSLRSADVVAALCQRIVGAIPGAAERDALVAASLGPVLDERMLAAVVGEDAAMSKFDWLQTLSFVAPAERGVTVHALAREALVADMRRRNSTRLAEIVACVMQHLAERLAAAKSFEDGLAITAMLVDFGRHHPVVRPYFHDAEAARLRLELSTSSVHPELVALVERFEGSRAAAICERWLTLQPHGARVVRDEADAVVGFALFLTLSARDQACGEWDPVVKAAFAHVTRLGGAADERMTIYRFLLGRDSYQAPSAAMQLCHEGLYQDTALVACRPPPIRHHFVCYHDFAAWEPVNLVYGCTRVEDACSVDGRRCELGYAFMEAGFAGWLEQVGARLAGGHATSPNAIRTSMAL